ncbi:MAG: dihydrofolate reductase family protein [Vampirovibrionales bacterium]|nr:dihydrofolate reductase family protein [Vampirovibrionales bacterium]
MHLIASFALSLDGKIGWPGSAKRLGSADDLVRFQALCVQAGCVIMGAETLRVFPKPLIQTPYTQVIFTRSGQLPWDAPVFAAPHVYCVIASTRMRPDDLSARHHWLTLDPAHPFEQHLQAVFTALVSRGCAQAVLAGGGQLFSQCVQAKAINELHLTLTPTLVGPSGTPLWTNATTEEEFTCVSAKTHGNEVWLEYRFKSN